MNNKHQERADRRREQRDLIDRFGTAARIFAADLPEWHWLLLSVATTRKSEDLIPEVSPDRGGSRLG
jgi:hypothetical protein